MNENGVDTTTTVEETGFIDDMGVDMSEYMDDGGGNQPAETDPVADAPAGETDHVSEEVPAEKQQPTGGDSVKIPVKVLGEEKELTVSEATPFIQKGMDYDRVKGQLHSANAELEQLRQFQSENADNIAFLQQLAQESNMSLSDMIDEIKAGQIMRKENVSHDIAIERVKRQNAERSLSAKNAAQIQQASAEAKKKADVAEFIRKFPGVTADNIPKEVWDKVNNGDTLVHAYEAHMTAKKDAEKDQEIANLKRELAALKQNAANKERSIGSQRADGQESAKDLFLETFLADD